MKLKANLALSGVALCALCVSLCQADVDPDADPDREPRVRNMEQFSAAQFNGDDGGFITLAAVAPPLPQSLGCTGGSVIGISLDASSSIVPVEFGEMQLEVAQFILETDDPTALNRNLYYANTFGTVLEETTAAVFPGTPNLDPNTDDAIFNEVRSFDPTKGGSNIAAGLRDLANQFESLGDPAYAGIAVLVTDSTASPAAPLSAAVAALKASTQATLGIDVTVVVVGVGNLVDVAELTSIASTGADGSALVFQIDFFNDIRMELEDALGNIDADGDGVNDCEDGCPADPGKTEPGSCGCGVPEGECASECRGSFGFSLASNVCFGSAAFNEVVDQVIRFVDESSGFPSGPANPNLYYANAVHHGVHSTTGLFDRNTEGDISAAILSDITFTPGGVNIAAGISDIRARFTTGRVATATGGRFAFIVTDGFDAPGPLATAAQALKDDGVAVIAIAPPGMTSLENLEAIASTPELVLIVNSLDEIAELLLSTVAGIDTDGDGSPDCEDSCPSDPTKVVPGICGCGEVDQTPCV